MKSRRRVKVIPLAVHQPLHVQGVHILESPFSKNGKNLVIETPPNRVRVFPAPQHLFFVVPLPKLSHGWVRAEARAPFLRCQSRRLAA